MNAVGFWAILLVWWGSIKDFLSTLFGAEVRDAPTQVDEMEPRPFERARLGAEPRFEIVIRFLPVLPDGSGGFDGARLGAEVIII